MIFQTAIELIACVCVLLTPAISEPIEDSQFQLEYRDGTLITSEFTEAQLMWTNVSEFGQTKKQPVDIRHIVSLTLTEEPVGDQLSAILKLVGQLDSEDYLTREEAEHKLRKTGRRFKSLITKYDTLETVDGTYRLKRVLSGWRGASKLQNGGISLDILKLDDGRALTTLTGDAGTNNLQLVVNGKEIAVDRKLLAKITRANKALVTRPDSRLSVETKLFHDHAKFMEGRKLKLVDFEHKPDGTPLRVKDKNINEQFVNFGLVLGTEYPMGCVGVSGYNFKAGDKPPGDNSVCVYKSRTRLRDEYEGVMEITFCQPGKRNVPHGVKDFGLFLANVTHSRDMLVEGYDSLDRLIAVCESNDEPCTFCGISSSIPIAKIRVVSNPWVLAARRQTLNEMRASDLAGDKKLLSNKSFILSSAKVDKDFAADNILFSTPVPIDSVRKGPHYQSRNGDMLLANWMRVFDKDRIEFGSRHINLMNVSLSQANTLTLKATPKTSVQQLKKRRTWMAMLRDNSVLEWSADTPLRSGTLKRDLSRDDVIAIWPSFKSPQLPLAGDFEGGAHVLVYPGCRITTPKVEIDKTGFRWTGGTVRQEDLHEVNDQKVNQHKTDVPDRITPRKTSYDFNSKSFVDFETPTIWFNKPTSILASQGVLKLDNGEILVYGPDALFQLESIDRKEAVLTIGGSNIVIPISKIISILPQQQ